MQLTFRNNAVRHSILLQLVFQKLFLQYIQVTHSHRGELQFRRVLLFDRGDRLVTQVLRYDERTVVQATGQRGQEYQRPGGFPETSFRIRDPTHSVGSRLLREILTHRAGLTQHRRGFSRGQFGPPLIWRRHRQKPSIELSIIIDHQWR